MCKTSENLLSIKPAKAGTTATRRSPRSSTAGFPVMTSAVSGFDAPVVTSTASSSSLLSSSNRYFPKKVHFAATVMEHCYSHNLSEAEKKQVWYNAVDFRNNRTECYFLNLKINVNGMDPKEYEENGHSWRGLEHIRQGALAQKVEQRRNTVRAFIYYYRIMGVKDVNALQVFSTRRTVRDRYIAQELANQDFCDACKIYQDHLNHCRPKA